MSNADDVIYVVYPETEYDDGWGVNPIAFLTRAAAKKFINEDMITIINAHDQGYGTDFPWWIKSEVEDEYLNEFRTREEAESWLKEHPPEKHAVISMLWIRDPALKAMTEALQFYADLGTYGIECDGTNCYYAFEPPIDADKGQRARAALNQPHAIDRLSNG